MSFNKINKHFELEFIKEDLKTSLKVKKKSIVRIEELEEIYKIKGLDDYTLYFYPHLKFYSVEQYNRKENTTNSVGMFTQKDVIEYLNIIIKNELDQACFKINNYILEINKCDDGWDYTLFNEKLGEIDGGQIDNPEIDILEAKDEIINELLEIKSLTKANVVLTEVPEDL